MKGSARVLSCQRRGGHSPTCGVEVAAGLFLTSSQISSIRLQSDCSSTLCLRTSISVMMPTRRAREHLSSALSSGAMMRLLPSSFLRSFPVLGKQSSKYSMGAEYSTRTPSQRYSIIFPPKSAGPCKETCRRLTTDFGGVDGAIRMATSSLGTTRSSVGSFSAKLPCVLATFARGFWSCSSASRQPSDGRFSTTSNVDIVPLGRSKRDPPQRATRMS
mmetsp:Transcript_58115/g.164907  ORF Transcript_58115/g.164907 Transcript_58115/m.164907 type:complete len:217 (-) Transcript_58115:94-744(-)